MGERERLSASTRLLVLQNSLAGKDLVSGLRKMGKFREMNFCGPEAALLITIG